MPSIFVFYAMFVLVFVPVNNLVTLTEAVVMLEGTWVERGTGRSSCLIYTDSGCKDPRSHGVTGHWLVSWLLAQLPCDLGAPQKIPQSLCFIMASVKLGRKVRFHKMITYISGLELCARYTQFYVTDWGLWMHGWELQRGHKINKDAVGTKQGQASAEQQELFWRSHMVFTLLCVVTSIVLALAICCPHSQEGWLGCAHAVLGLGECRSARNWPSLPTKSL